MNKTLNKYYKIWIVAEDFPYNEDVIHNVKIGLYKDKLSEKENNLLPLMISNYKLKDKVSKIYAQTLIEELFTIKEIDEIKIFFNKMPKNKLSYKEVKLPLNTEGLIGYSACPVGRGSPDRLEFYKDDLYSLSYPLCGFYDIRRNIECRKN